MTMPEQNESLGSNEPEHLEADGYLVKALRRLGEGLGRFVYRRTQDEELIKGSSVTRDVQPILRTMVGQGNWDRYFAELGRDGRNWVSELIEFRNGPWAHLAGYSDNDVLHYLGVIERLLRAVSAYEQAQAVEQMYAELGKLIFSETRPERPREIENAELRQQIFDLKIENSDLRIRNSQIIGQLEGFQYAASLMAFSSAAVAPIETSVFSSTDNVAPSDGLAIAHESAEDFLQRGNEARREGYIEAALDHYSRAIELSPYLAKAYAGRGNAYADGEEYELAITDYSDGLRLSPDNAVYYFYRGFAYAALSDHDRAISDYSDALRHNAANELAMAAYGNRGNAYRIQGEYDRAIADYDAALNLNPNDEVAAGLYFNRGNAYRAQGNHDSAIADISEALRLDTSLVEAYDVRGFAYFCKEEYGLAIADYDMALHLDPKYESAYFARGYAHFIKGEYDSTISDCGVALQFAPDFLFAYVIRALAFAFKDEHDQAIADFESALALEPDDDLTELALEGMRLSQGSKDLAVRLQEMAEYDKYIEENPRDPQGWHLRGLYSLECEDYSSAVAEFTIAIKWAEFGVGPDDATVWNDRGWARWQQGDDDFAYDDFSKAIELKPDFANAYYNRAWVWRRRGDHGNAIIDFSQAIALKPDYAASYQHRGISYFDIGDRYRAQADFEIARDLGFSP